MFKSSKILVALVAVVICSSVSHAKSTHPCTPTVQAAPIRINCKSDQNFYTIIVNTLMSPNISMCRGKNYFEYKTAEVSVVDENGQELAEIKISNGAFQYRLGLNGSTFDSEPLFIHLDQCVTPSHGGFSVGN